MDEDQGAGPDDIGGSAVGDRGPGVRQARSAGLGPGANFMQTAWGPDHGIRLPVQPGRWSAVAADLPEREVRQEGRDRRADLQVRGELRAAERHSASTINDSQPLSCNSGWRRLVSEVLHKLDQT